MQLILWRHAEAEDGLDDLARPLTPRGRKQAQRVGAWLRERLPKHTRILVSPASRTQQTAAGLGLTFTTEPSIAPGARAEAVLAAAGWGAAEEGCVLVVGHQPTLGEVASRLLGGTSSVSVRKGSVWWFSAREGTPGRATLLASLSPDLV